MLALMEEAKRCGLAGRARKAKPVDARLATPGEVVETRIAGQGIETRNRAAAGDWLVRNRCDTSGGEIYLVRADKFLGRYERTAAPTATDGWQEFRPLGKVMTFFVVAPEHGTFTFDAPWHERMVAKPGDAIVQDPADPRDLYRVAAASFACTFDILD